MLLSQKKLFGLLTVVIGVSNAYAKPITNEFNFSDFAACATNYYVTLPEGDPKIYRSPDGWVFENVSRYSKSYGSAMQFKWGKTAGSPQSTALSPVFPRAITSVIVCAGDVKDDKTGEEHHLILSPVANGEIVSSLSHSLAYSETKNKWNEEVVTWPDESVKQFKFHFTTQDSLNWRVLWVKVVYEVDGTVIRIR